MRSGSTKGLADIQRPGIDGALSLRSIGVDGRGSNEARHQCVIARVGSCGNARDETEGEKESAEQHDGDQGGPESTLGWCAKSPGFNTCGDAATGDGDWIAEAAFGFDLVAGLRGCVGVGQLDKKHFELLSALVLPSARGAGGRAGLGLDAGRTDA